MEARKEKLQTIYLYCIMVSMIVLLGSLSYLLYDDTIKETVVYIIGGCELSLLIFVALIWKLNRNNG